MHKRFRLFLDYMLRKILLILESLDRHHAGCLTAVGFVCVITLFAMCAINYWHCSFPYGRNNGVTDNAKTSNRIHFVSDNQLSIIKDDIDSLTNVMKALNTKNPQFSPLSTEIVKERQISQKLSRNDSAILHSQFQLNLRIDSIAKITEPLVADIRQETNNNLDKSNAWLSFWLAIMAIVGVIIPWGWQLKLNRDEREKFKEFSHKSESKINEELEKVRNRVEDDLKAIDAIKYDQDLLLTTSLLSKCSEYRISQELRNSSSLEEQLWSKIRSDLSKLIDMSFKLNEHNGFWYLENNQTTSLVVALACIYEVITLKARDTQLTFKQIEFENLTDKIRLAIRHIAQHPLSPATLRDELITICDSLEFYER